MKKKINLTDYEISELQRKVGSRVEELFLKIPASTPMPGKIRMMNKILSEVSHAYKQAITGTKNSLTGTDKIEPKRRSTSMELTIDWRILVAYISGFLAVVASLAAFLGKH